MSQSKEVRYRPVHVEAPSNGQDLKATGEGVSIPAEDTLDEDTNVSGGKCNKQACRIVETPQKVKKPKKGERKR